MSTVKAANVNTLRDAIIAIEAELGVKPSGIYGTVRTRLDALEALITSQSGGGGGGGSVTFAGDLIGTNIHQVVVGLQNNPISSVMPTTGQFLVWNGSAWAPENGITFATLRINHASNPNLLTTAQSSVLVDVSAGTVSLGLPGQGMTAVQDGFLLTIKNSVGDASVNPITVNAFGGQLVESITSPGIYLTSIPMNILSQSITLQYDANLNRWMVI